MRVLIDASSARSGGGITYVRNIVPALAQVCPDHDFEIVLSSSYQGQLAHGLPDNFRAVTIPLVAEPLFQRWFQLQVELRRIMSARKIDLLFGVAEGVYLPLGIPVVMMVRNLALYSPPPSVKTRLRLLPYRWARKPLMHWSLRRADELIFVSEASRTIILESMSLPSDVGRVIPHGVDPSFSIASCNRNHRAPYLLTVSTVTPHKNYEVLVKGFCRLLRNPSYEDYELFIVGGLKHSQTVRRIRQIAYASGHEDRVRLCGAVPHEKLPPLYHGAEAFVFPSQFETFGNPLLEAMAAGTPIVAAKSPASRELCGDAAAYFDGSSAASLEEQLGIVLKDQERIGHLARLGRARVHEFTWRKSARLLSKTFDEVFYE